MDTFSTVVKFFQDCGLFIYPSALIMALGITIAVERYIFLSKARNQNRKVWAQVLPLLQKGQLRDVQSVANQSDAAVGKIVSYGLTRMQSPGRREDFDAAMEEGMMEIVPRLEKRTHYIATFANVITLVGLLGTIIGLIKGFTAVAQRQPGREGADALGLDLDRDEQHRVRADGRDSVPAGPFVPPGQDQRDRRRPRGREDELPEPRPAPEARARGRQGRLSSPAPEYDRRNDMPARRLKKTQAHLEITAFINLIVVLVPFLLSVSVFTHLAVIDLSLPAQSNDQVQKLDPNKPLKLEVDRAREPHRGRTTSTAERCPDRRSRTWRPGPTSRGVSALLQALKLKYPAARRRQRPGRERDPVRPRGAGDGRRSRRPSGAGRVASSRPTTSRTSPSATRRSSGNSADMKPLTPLQKRAERRNRNQSMVDMNLVSLIDVFTILIFFLMSNVGVETICQHARRAAAGIDVAEAAQGDGAGRRHRHRDPGRRQGRRFGQGRARRSTSDLIQPLKAELDVEASREVILKENEGDSKRVTIMGDKDIPYRLLRKVMFTAARAGFSDVSFAVRQRFEP